MERAVARGDLAMRGGERCPNTFPLGMNDERINGTVERYTINETSHRSGSGERQAARDAARSRQ
jgi:hypothetical protein